MLGHEIRPLPITSSRVGVRGDWGEGIPYPGDAL